jgi:hypothetical protein
MRVLGAFCLALLVPSLACAHHSFAEFDQKNTIEIAGTLSAVAWQNPHVKLKVQSEQGGRLVTYDIECHSVGILSRSNVDVRVLKVGDQVKVAGNPSKTSAVRMFATNLLTSSGRELVMAPGVKPRWQADTSVFAFKNRDTGSAQPATAGLFKVWSSGVDAETVPISLWRANWSLTPAAQKALAAWDPVHDTIARGCKPKGMPTIMEQPYGMEFEDHGATILLRLEEYDTVRTIHVSDGARPPKAKSLLGHSTGQWDGATLVVTTTGISWPYIAPNGLPQGPTSSMVERFTVTPDGKRLQYTVTITDPDTFETPAVLKRAWVWLPNERVKKYACGTKQSLPQ